jgi:hypothetical protein
MRSSPSSERMFGVWGDQQSPLLSVSMPSFEKRSLLTKVCPAYR